MLFTWHTHGLLYSELSCVFSRSQLQVKRRVSAITRNKLCNILAPRQDSLRNTGLSFRFWVTYSKQAITRHGTVFYTIVHFVRFSSHRLVKREGRQLNLAVLCSRMKRIAEAAHLYIRPHSGSLNGLRFLSACISALTHLHGESSWLRGSAACSFAWFFGPITSRGPGDGGLVVGARRPLAAAQFAAARAKCYGDGSTLLWRGGEGSKFGGGDWTSEFPLLSHVESVAPAVISNSKKLSDRLDPISDKSSSSIESAASRPATICAHESQNRISGNLDEIKEERGL